MSNVFNLGSYGADLVLQDKGFTSGLKNAEAQTKNFEKSMDNLNRNIAKTTATIVGLTAAIATATSGFTHAVKTAADFEQAMAKVKAVSGATGDEFDTLRKKAMELGASTVFSSSQAAEAQYQLATAGFKTTEIIAALPSVLDGAAAAQIDLGKSAEIVGEILNGFGLNANETTHVMDVLTKASIDSNSGLLDLGSAMHYIAPLAKSLGISVEETTSAISLLSNAGIKGESAGTALRGALTQLLNPSAESKKLMDALGISITDNEGKMKSLGGIVEAISKGLNGMTEASRNAAVAQLVGTESASGFLVLIDAGKGKIDNFTNSLKDSAGVTKEIEEVQNNTLQGSLKQLESAFEALSITVGDKFSPTIRSAADELSHMTLGFTNLSAPAQNAVIAFTAVSTAAGILVTTIYAVRAALVALELSVPVVGGIALAIGGLAAALAYSQTESEKVTLSLDKQKAATGELSQEAEALEQKLSTLQKGTDEYNKTNNVLQNIYQQILAQNPDLKKGFEEQGKSVDWLSGRVRQLSAEYVAMQKNAWNAAATAIDAQVSQKRQQMDLAKQEISGWDENNIDENIRKQIKYKTQEYNDLKNDVVGLQQQKFKLWQQYNSAVNQPVTAEQVMNKYDPPSTSKVETGSKHLPSTSSSSSSKDTINEAYQSDLQIAQQRYELMKQVYGDSAQLLESHIGTLQGIQTKYSVWLQGKELERLQLETDIATKENDLEHKKYDYSAKWIQDKKAINELSLNDELAAWQRVQSRFAEGTEERKNAEKEIYRVTGEIEKKQLEDLVTAHDAAENKIKNNLQDIQNQMDSINKNDKDYFSKKEDLLNQSIQQHLQEKQILQQDIDTLKKRNETLQESDPIYQSNEKQIESWTQAIKSSDKAVLDSNRQLNQLKEDMANEVVNAEKAAYQAIEQAKLKSIDIQMTAEDNRHKQVMDNLDSEMQKFQDTIDAQLKAIDQQSAAEDYASNLSKAQKDAQDIQSQINTLSLDDSIESKAKKEALAKELADKQTAIAKLQSDHEKELRKQNLQNQLDSYKKQIDAKKSAEDDAYDATKDSLDKQKQATQDYYDNILNDERRWQDLHKSIVSGSVKDAQNTLMQLSGSVKGNMNLIGKSISENLIAQLQQAIQLMQQLNAMQGKSPVPSGSNTSPSGSNTTPSNGNSSGSSSDRYSNQLAYLNSLVNGGGGNSTWASDQLHKIQNMGQNEYNYLYGLISSGGGQSEWAKNYFKEFGIEVFHDGGWVGGDIFSGLKQDEVPSILQRGEYVLSKNMLQDIASFGKSFNTTSTNNTTNKSNNTFHFNPTLNVEYKGGLQTKRELDDFSKQLLEPLLNHWVTRLKSFGLM